MSESRWTVPLDLYCERLGPGFWAEPVNAVSNAAFIVAGLAGLAMLRRRRGRDLPALLLAGVVLAVGIGSFLFHTFANRWSLLADVVPIAVFIYGYVFLALTRYTGWPWWWALVATGVFMAFNVNVDGIAAALLGPGLVGAMRGSLGYVPALAALLVVGTGLAVWGRVDPPPAGPGADHTRAKAPTAGRALLLAAGIFALSLTFRTMDVPVCGALPLGTHFLWHVLNAVVLYVLLSAAIRHRDAMA